MSDGRGGGGAAAALAGGVLAVAVACGGASAPGPGAGQALLPPHHYRAEVGAERVDLTLWLPPSDAPGTVDLPALEGRAARRAQLVEVRCDGEPLPRSPGGWTTPAGCGVLTWSVQPAPVRGPVDPAAQRAVRDPEAGWWFLPGAALFLIPEGATQRPTLDLRHPEGLAVHHALPAARGPGLMLPAPSALGRVLIGAGDFLTRTTTDGQTRYRHHFDRAPVFEMGDLSITHAQGAAYLQRVTGIAPPTLIDVFWFARDPADRAVSGAAGVSAVAVAHFTEPLGADAPAHARHAPVMVLLHEQFHVMVGAELPAWASESLAHYYALKALLSAGAMSAEELRGFIEPFQPAAGTESLLSSQSVWERRRAEDRSDAPAAAYASFYTLGAAFWHALDRAIEEETGGERSLDSILPQILGLIFVDGGSPPRRFLEVLEGAGLPRSRAMEITRLYLGWPATPHTDA